MLLIISEKSIAGERIAELLADAKMSQRTIEGARVFEFNWNGIPVRLIPLRGHISDVEFPKKYSNWRTTDVRTLIDAEVLYAEKEWAIIKCIRASAPEADGIIIATDADREGEAIGLEAITYAMSTNPKLKVQRAYFSAITKEDMDKSFSHLEKFDYNFAYSANARREIDLIWGAVLTRHLSLISGQIGKDFLSVGRVQTPTLALVVNREKERLAFAQKKYFELTIHCQKPSEPDPVFIALHSEEKFWDKERAQTIFAKDPKKATVKSVDTKMRILKKPTPFNTTEYIRAATGIGFAAGRAMDVAETLYQRGYTSYPRTDNATYPASLNLKDVLNKLASIKELTSSVKQVLAQKEIIPSAGKETKDHPPIYPVTAVQRERLTPEEWKIYELIARRFLATLAEDAQTENTSVLLDAQGEPYIARGQTIVLAGWKDVYPYSKVSETMLPKLASGDVVDIVKSELLEKETQPPARYSQGSLIKLMEENNLGTKSTRPAIIQKLYARNYISGNKSIEPSKVAFTIIDALDKHCDIVVKPKMTAELEGDMDEIAAGKKTKEVVVADSGKDLKEIMEVLFKNKDALGLQIRSALFSSGGFGKCTKCNKGNLVLRKAKASGKRFVGCNNYPACTNSYSLPQKGTITPLVNQVCTTCSAPMIKVRAGKFSYTMCLNMSCSSKNEWRKKNEENTVAAARSTPAATKPKVKRASTKKAAKSAAP